MKHVTNLKYKAIGKEHIYETPLLLKPSPPSMPTSTTPKQSFVSPYGTLNLKPLHNKYDDDGNKRIISQSYDVLYSPRKKASIDGGHQNVGYGSIGKKVSTDIYFLKSF